MDGWKRKVEVEEEEEKTAIKFNEANVIANARKTDEIKICEVRKKSIQTIIYPNAHSHTAHIRMPTQFGVCVFEYVNHHGSSYQHIAIDRKQWIC